MWPPASSRYLLAERTSTHSRHHRKSHLPCFLVGFRHVGALNASRHHRKSHEARDQIDEIQGKCSTPLGIHGTTQFPEFCVVQQPAARCI